jgi:hypothetical protein
MKGGTTMTNREWRTRAACRGADSEAFFPLDETNARLTVGALAICGACPVVTDCLLDVLATDTAPHVGIRGGMTGPERDALIATDPDELLRRHAATAHERNPHPPVGHGRGRPKPAGYGRCKGCGDAKPIGGTNDVRVLTHYVKGYRCSGSRRAPSERVDA